MNKNEDDSKPATTESVGFSKESTSVKSKGRNRGKKRKRRNSQSSSESEDVLADNSVEVDRSLHASAIKNNLDETSVRKIIKKVVTNDRVLALVKLREEEDSGTEEDRLRPKLTRAKVKELMKVSPKTHSTTAWNLENLELTPIKHIPVKTRPEVKALIAQELPEDEDDEEYEPTNDDVPSDDDMQSCSDIDSQPRTPATPRSQHSTSPKVVKDGPFKVPQEVSTPTRRKLDLEEEATIALRTRSKLSLSSTSIEHIESTFVPPDDIPMPAVDDLWNQFLNECLNPASTSKNEDDDETDPEYNVAADPDALNKCKTERTKKRNLRVFSALRQRNVKTREQVAINFVPSEIEENIGFVVPSRSNFLLPPKSPPVRIGKSPLKSPSLTSCLQFCSLQNEQANKRELLQLQNNLSLPKQNCIDDFDSVDLLFLGFARTLKKLPVQDQIKIKLDLHTAICQSEIRLYRIEETVKTATNVIKPHWAPLNQVAITLPSRLQTEDISVNSNTNIQTTAYTPKSPTYVTKSPTHATKSPIHVSPSPTKHVPSLKNVPESPTYYGHKSPIYISTSPDYDPISRICEPATLTHLQIPQIQLSKYTQTSPAYMHTSLTYHQTPTRSPSPVYLPTSPSYMAISPTYAPTSPKYATRSPTSDYKSPPHNPTLPSYNLISPTYMMPTSPSYNPTSP